MGTCQYCAKEANTVSDAIGYCADCIRIHFEEIRSEKVKGSTVDFCSLALVFFEKTIWAG